MAEAATDATGTITGTTITLDTPIPSLEGRRVHILIEPADEELLLSKREQQDAWEQWVQRNDDGPIVDDDEEAEVP
jgi:hypothetical protein